MKKETLIGKLINIKEIFYYEKFLYMICLIYEFADLI